MLQHAGVVNTVAGGQRPPSRKLWHIAGCKRGVDYERRRRNVYDKKPQRYAKDNRTAHLTACSDKSVACVTNNKSLYSTFCTLEANYWQTRSIARPLCDSRATCDVPIKRLTGNISISEHMAGLDAASPRIMGLKNAARIPHPRTAMPPLRFHTRTRQLRPRTSYERATESARPQLMQFQHETQ